MILNPTPGLPTGTEPNLFRALTRIFAEWAIQINGLSNGSIAAVNAQASYPTTGDWAKGDFITNSNPTELGGAGSKYIVLGWKRLTNGSGNVLNTDWFEFRGLTGN